MLLGSRLLNIDPMHFIFGTKDVTIDTEQLAKKFLNFVHYCPKKGPRTSFCYTQNIDLVSERKTDFGKFYFEYMSYVLTYGLWVKVYVLYVWL